MIWCLLALPPVVFLLFYAAYQPNEPLINPDSQSYLTFAPIRTSGYPFFLNLFEPFIRDVADYTIIQRGLYALSVWLLGVSMARYLRWPILALLAEFLLLGNPLVNRYHFAIFTESLTLSTITLFFAASLWFVCRQSLLALALTSALAAACIAIRPSAVVILLPLVALVLLYPPLNFWKKLAAAVIPGLIVLALDAGYYRLHHGNVSASLLPIHSLAKGGLVALSTPAAIRDAPVDRQPLDQKLETDLAPVRALIRQAPNLAARCRLLANYEVFVQYQFAIPERSATATVGGMKRLQDAGFARLAAAPLGYAELTLQHWACLWTLWAASDSQKQVFVDFLNQHRPLPYEAQMWDSLQTAPSMPLANLVPLAMAGIALLSAAAVIALLVGLFRPLDPLLVTAGLAGLVLHGGLLLTAMTGVGIPRYVLGLWPALVLSAGLMVWWLAAWLWRRYSHADSSR